MGVILIANGMSLCINNRIKICIINNTTLKMHLKYALKSCINKGTLKDISRKTQFCYLQSDFTCNKILDIAILLSKKLRQCKRDIHYITILQLLCK